MTDTAPGPGWWMASDGRWYPPELHPQAAAPPPPAADPPPPAADPPLPPIFATNSTTPSGPAAGTVPGGPPPGFTAPGPLPPVAIYPEHGARPAAGTPAAASRPSAPPPGARRKGRSTWPSVLIVVGLLAVVGGGVAAIVLSLKAAPTFPDAAAVAVDFVEVGVAQSYRNMSDDVAPSQRASFDAQSESDKLFGVAQIGGTPYVTTAGKAQQGNDTIINVVACFNPGGGGACVPNQSSELTLRIPAVQVGGSWYVDAGQLAALNPNPQVVPPSGIIP